MKPKMRFIFCSTVHVTTIFNKGTETKANFLLLNDVEKLGHIVVNHFIYVGKFIVDAMQQRKSVLYNCNHTFTASIFY